MKSLRSSTNVSKIILAVLSLLFLALGIYAMVKDYGAVALLAGIFCGKLSTNFFYLIKNKD
jgi:hypothetical protein